MGNVENTQEEQKSETQVIDDVVAAAVEEAVEEAGTVEQVEPVEQEKAEEEMTPEEINWKVVREKTKEDRIARDKEKEQSLQKDDQIEALTLAIQNMFEAKDAPDLTKKQQDQIIADLVDEDIPTGGEVKNFLKKYVPDLIKEALTQNAEKNRIEQVARDKEEMPEKLKEMHKDFDDVVQKDNLQYLDYHFPEVSGVLNILPEGLDKWSRVYKMIKKLVPNTGRGDLRRLEKNANKPQNVAAATAPPSNEQGYGRTLSEGEKKENYKRLIELSRGA